MKITVIISDIAREIRYCEDVCPSRAHLTAQSFRDILFSHPELYAVAPDAKQAMLAFLEKCRAPLPPTPLFP